MKKTLLTILSMVLCLSMQAAVTLDFTNAANDWGIPSGSSNGLKGPETYTNGTYSITLCAADAYYFNSQGYLMLGKSGSYLTLPTVDFAVGTIVVGGRSGASANTVMNIYVDDTAVSTACTSSQEDHTYVIDSNYQTVGTTYTFKITNAYNAQITSITLYAVGEDVGSDQPSGHGYEPGDPYTVSELIPVIEALSSGGTISGIYVKGIVSQIDEISTSYGNMTYYISDDGTTTNQLYIFRGKSLNNAGPTTDSDIKVSDVVVVYGTFVNYNGTTPEGQTGNTYIYSLESGDGDGGGDGGNTGSSIDDFENGGFEEWTDSSSPVGWTGNTASSATLSQSTDAHGGNYAVNVAHKTSNQRLASKDYTLAAGTYDVSFYVKSADADALGKVRGGYYDGSNYVYESATAVEVPAEWTEHTFSFTLTAETKVEFIVMNNSGGAGDLLVDDFTVKAGESASGHGYEADDPFTASEALALAQTLNASTTLSGVYVKGIIVSVSDIDTGTYGNATYYISDDGSETNQLEIYRGYYLEGAKFTNEDQIQDGDEVVVTGDLVNYNGTTPEITTGSKIYSLNGKTSDDSGGTTSGEGHGYEQDDPFSVSEVIALAETLSSSDTVTGVYVKGIVSKIDSFNSNYGDMDYHISDDGTTTNQFYIYNGYYLDGEKFTSADQIKVSDTVIVTGDLTNYLGTTPELARGSKIVYLEEGDGEGGSNEPDPSLILTLENSGVTAGSETATIDFTSQGLENEASVDGTEFTLSDGSTVVFAKADGNNAPTYYTNGTAVRAYAMNTITFACSQEIAKIEMVCNSSQYLGNDTYTIEWSDTGAVYCNYNEEDGEPKNSGGTQLRVQQIIVTYAGDAGDDTGISAVEAEWTNGDGVMYNIGGQRVSDTYRGIVIVNGRKILKK